MKKISILIITILFVSCAVQKVSKPKLVMKYYEGFKKSDYQEVKNVLSDSLIITEGDYLMEFTQESYYEHFKWDSVFRPVYKIIELKNHPWFVACQYHPELKSRVLKAHPLFREFIKAAVVYTN